MRDELTPAVQERLRALRLDQFDEVLRQADAQAEIDRQRRDRLRLLPVDQKLDVILTLLDRIASRVP